MPNQIIAIEEHFTSPQLRKLIAPREGPIQKMLDEMGGQRIKDMDEAGIDIAVLSENNPAAHNLDPETSVTMAKASNDFLHQQIQGNPRNASRASPRCRCPIRKPPPTSSSAA